MAPAFKLIAQDCGFTMMEAASFLNVQTKTAKSWWLGRRACPEDVIEELLHLSIKQDMAARKAVDIIEKATFDMDALPEKIEIGLSTDDYEAQSLGWPFVSAHGAVIRKMIRMLPIETAKRIVIVPRGSTSATAAAAT